MKARRHIFSSALNIGLKRLCVPISLLTLAACATINPAPLSEDELAPSTQADLAAAQRDVAPLTGSLTLEEALARALKYNLDHRAKLIEEAIALGQLDVAQFDLPPIARTT